MKTFTVKTPYDMYYDCFFYIGKYQVDNSVAIQIWNDIDGPIADITTCLGDAGEEFGYVDTNNCPWATKLIEDLGIGNATGIIEPSGFCMYPLYRFDMEKIKEYARE